MQTIKLKFVKHQPEVQTKSSEPAKEKEINPIKKQLLSLWKSLKYRVVPNNVQDQVDNKLGSKDHGQSWNHQDQVFNKLESRNHQGQVFNKLESRNHQGQVFNKLESRNHQGQAFHSCETTCCSDKGQVFNKHKMSCCTWSDKDQVVSKHETACCNDKGQPGTRFKRHHSPVVHKVVLLTQPGGVKLKQEFNPAPTKPKQPPIIQTLVKPLLHTTKTKQTLTTAQIEKVPIQLRNQNNEQITKKQLQKPEPPERQEYKSEQKEPAVSDTEPYGQSRSPGIDQSRSPSIGQSRSPGIGQSRSPGIGQSVAGGDGMEDLKPVLSLRIQTVVSESGSYIRGTWSRGTPNKKHQVVICQQKFSPGQFTPLKLPDNWEEETQKDAQKSEDPEEESLLCHETIDTIHVEDKDHETMDAIHLEVKDHGFPDPISEEISGDNNKHLCSSQIQSDDTPPTKRKTKEAVLSDDTKCRRNRSDETPPSTKRKTKESVLSDNTKCRRKSKGMHPRRKKNSSKTVAKDATEQNSASSQITCTKVVE
ncbi:uncharacterized protein LOC106179231 [Lingula anatina]|uniref:Uncharacterized protein LOC106179231 n=1 Tax=Lingula anatina TaxID=7574 RepID=A0A1S3K7I4_LINAN|nr:uncharacterized protein LOC106179231 [Lingula anatina]|eukprot:XP_013418226.1 uncharacterized protein LOC106179231 [Lingula anatina]